MQVSKMSERKLDLLKLLSLENFEIMDYQQEGDVGFKKIKVVLIS